MQQVTYLNSLVPCSSGRQGFGQESKQCPSPFLSGIWAWHRAEIRKRGTWRITATQEPRTVLTMDGVSATTTQPNPSETCLRALRGETAGQLVPFDGSGNFSTGFVSANPRKT